MWLKSLGRVFRRMDAAPACLLLGSWTLGYGLGGLGGLGRWCAMAWLGLAVTSCFPDQSMSEVGNRLIDEICGHSQSRRQAAW
jgi:hypothetical protein